MGKWQGEMCSHGEEGFGGNTRVEKIDDLIVFALGFGPFVRCVAMAAFFFFPFLVALGLRRFIYNIC